MCEAIIFWLCISALIVCGLPELCEWLNQQDRLRAARVKPVRSRNQKLFSCVACPLWSLAVIVGAMVL
jgi:hypothetical protein